MCFVSGAFKVFLSGLFRVLLTCIRLACLCPLEADHLVFFNMGAHCVCVCLSGEVGLGDTFPVLLPQIPPPALSHTSAFDFTRGLTLSCSLQIPTSSKWLLIFCHRQRAFCSMSSGYLCPSHTMGKCPRSQNALTSWSFHSLSGGDLRKGLTQSILTI